PVDDDQGGVAQLPGEGEEDSGLARPGGHDPQPRLPTEVDCGQGSVDGPLLVGPKINGHTFSSRGLVQLGTDAKRRPGRGPRLRKVLSGGPPSRAVMIAVTTTGRRGRGPPPHHPESPRRRMTVEEGGW